MSDGLYIVTAVSNPIRYRSRYALYERFARHVEQSGGKLLTVELAFGERPHALTGNANPWHLQLRTSHELWHKENLLNLGIAHLTRMAPDWKYVAWIDADVSFARPDWVEETWQQLQHYAVVQMFSEAHDLDPTYGAFMRHRSFAWCHWNGVAPQHHPTYAYAPQGPKGAILWHPGFAWAARRDALETLGGLLDVGILGANDNHMAKALVGNGAESMHPEVSAGYRASVLGWQSRAALLRRDFGYVEGLLLHHWHGKKKDRRYWDRWQVLVESQFDPLRDLARDSSGVYRLHPENVKLRDGIRRYFRSRNEDSIDTDGEGNLS